MNKTPEENIPKDGNIWFYLYRLISIHSGKFVIALLAICMTASIIAFLLTVTVRPHVNSKTGEVKYIFYKRGSKIDIGRKK